MLGDFAYGRQDAQNASQCGSVEIPSGSNWVNHLQGNGFSDEEIVALASIEAFGNVRNPTNARWSSHPRLDNYYYK